MTTENLLIVSVLPERDPTAQAAMEAIRQNAVNTEVVYAYEKDFRPCVGCKDRLDARSLAE